MSDPMTTFALEERTVGQVLARHAARQPDKLAIASPTGESFTYAALDAMAHRIAHGAAALGLGEQEPVLVMLPDEVDYLLVWCGLARRGAIEVPVNLAYKGQLLAHVCNESGARSIIVDARMLDRLEAVADQLTSLERCIVWSAEGAAAGAPVLPAALARRCTAVRFDALIAEGGKPFESTVAFHDLVAIMFTSGTTGPSKGVMVSQAQSFAYAYKCSLCYDPTPESVLYTAGLPLFHCAGQWAICYAALMHGGTVVVRNGYRNEFFWDDVRRFGCTGALLLGAVGSFIWKQEPRDDDRDHTLRAVLMAPVIAQHEAFTERFGVKVGSAYGSTELPPVAVLRPGEPCPSRACTGSIQDDYEVRILDEFDREVPMGQVGEICARPKNPWAIMAGYWNRPEATAKAFRNLWFHTGDAGYVDDQGRLYFFDRLTDSMRRRGENVSASEVELEILRHPDIAECAAFPVWDENTEQEIMVAVVPRPGVSPDFAAMVGWLDGRMPYFMIPRYWDVVDELPRTANGKLRKGPLRERGVGPATWDRVAAGIKLRR